MKKLKMDQSSILGASPLNIFFIDYHEVVFVELGFYHFTYYVLFLERHFILLSVLFCLLFCWSYDCWILALFVWERDTLHFFI